MTETIDQRPDRMNPWRDLPAEVRDAALETDAVAWVELVGWELSGRSLEANAGVNFVDLIEKLHRGAGRLPLSVTGALRHGAAGRGRG